MRGAFRSRKRPLIASAVAATLVAGDITAAPAPIDPAKLSHGYTFAGSQLAYTASQYSSTQFPATTSSTTGQWITRARTDWRAGFFPGQNWLMYARTGDTAWRDRAVTWTNPLTPGSVTQDHDIGFVTIPSWGQAMHLGATPAYRDSARTNILAAAQVLDNRFKPAMGLIDSWINLEEPNGVCIDNMMNLELLFTAHALGGSQKFRDDALTHAQTTREEFFRADGGTYHVVRHLDNGTVARKNTMQGYGDETTWSRGQAWAIHGFSTTYRFTRDAQMLDTAKLAADYFIARLPNYLSAATNPHNALSGDFVPPSDFDAELGEPEGPWNDADNDGVPNETSADGSSAGPPPRTWVDDRLLPQNTYTLRDSSAAAVAASGLLDLARLVPADTAPNIALREKYFTAARDMLNSLLTHDSANPDLNYLADGVVVGQNPLRSILARGSERWGAPNNGLSYGDYYLLEAMQRYEHVGMDFLPQSVGNQWAGGDGNWGSAARWTAATVPNGIGQAAHFRTLASAVSGATVTLDAPRTSGVMTFNNAGKYTVQGPSALRLERAGGAEAQVHVERSPQSGHEIAAPMTLASDTSITTDFGAALRLTGPLGVSPAGAARNLHKHGEGSLFIAGAQHWPAGSTLRVFAGSLTLASDAAGGAAGGVDAGTLHLLAEGGMATLAGKQRLAGLTVNGAARVTLEQGGASPLAVGELAVAGGAIDLKDNVLVTAAPVGTASGMTYTGLSGLIQSGRNGGAWDGSGLVTTMPDASLEIALTSLGIATAAEINRAGTTFRGFPVAASDTIVMYTYAGDANLDGFISGDDYSAIDFAVGVPGASGWVNGDFNYDGLISGDDYSAIDFNLLAQGAPFPTASSGAESAASAVPEPTSAMVVLLTAMAAWGVRRLRAR